MREAAKEIQFGNHVQLDWSMNNLQFPGSGRATLCHHVKEMEAEGFVGLDDEIYINTQTSSQWDSLKHVRFSLPHFQVLVFTVILYIVGDSGPSGFL